MHSPRKPRMSNNQRRKPQVQFDDDEVASSTDLEIAEKVSNVQLYSKFFLYMFLVSAMVAASVLTYLNVSNREKDEFEKEFQSKAGEIERLFSTVKDNRFVAAENLALTISSHARASDLLFPNVTYPDYKRIAEKARQMSHSSVAIFTPLVPSNLQDGYESFVQNNHNWINDGLAFHGVQVDPGPVPLDLHDVLAQQGAEFVAQGVGEGVTDYDGPFIVSDDGSKLVNLASPVWQSEPAPINATIVNADLQADDTFQSLSLLSARVGGSVLSRMRSGWDLLSYFPSGETMEGQRRAARSPSQPSSYVLAPVFWDPKESKGLVGFVLLVFSWEQFVSDLVSQGSGGVALVIGDSCGSNFTYEIEGNHFSFKGSGDRHNPKYNSWKRTLTHTVVRGEMKDLAPETQQTMCQYGVDIYPTTGLQEGAINGDPFIFAVVIAALFFFTAIVFAGYDFLAAKRQDKVARAAEKTQTIISSIFPKNVQERVLQNVNEDKYNTGSKRMFRATDYLQDFVAVGESKRHVSDGNRDKWSKPIADLFPEATVAFLDIVGFTAWSSTREPTQVFQLLESVFLVFDTMARKRRIFKVETVGDCYVAVAGLPEPREDNALAMARFATDCLAEFTKTTKSLVLELGPDTEDLGLRIGLHTGPVTAGVLRGDKARFQLFGDTMNTAARMESTGARSRIHVSEETASALKSFGKTEWLMMREDKVVAKGKGKLSTYWIAPDRFTWQIGGYDTDFQLSSDAASHTGSSAPEIVNLSADSYAADKSTRLIAWNNDVMARLLKQIVARRQALQIRPDRAAEIKALERDMALSRNVLDEVQEVVRLPRFSAVGRNIDPSSVKLGFKVEAQLHSYVRTLAAMYRDNPFHNFEHASHVTMSVMKLLSRIVAPNMRVDSDQALHDHTYGITSDPMTQFAVVFSALIHDADHPGVPNTQLIRENRSLASMYRNKSVAEQNSVCLAWDLLMQDDFNALRSAIYVTKSEFVRFRQLVVNTVLATDILDKDLGALRKGRWQTAFSEGAPTPDNVHRKATIVIEHLIQASDVAHTMQHWHIFRKWNARLFCEMYDAYAEGRASRDPSQFWYESEKGFFDYYVIPLARKLKDCGVFGVSSDEYLQYAVQNRALWEKKGQHVVATMVEDYKKRALPQQNAPRVGSQIRFQSLGSGRMGPTRISSDEVFAAQM